MAENPRQPDRHEPTVVDPYARSVETFREPPQGLGSTLRHLGPGMILAGSVVGSGELIITTKLGAEVGFVLLWLVLLSCVIKVVVQAELARHTISSGKTFLAVFNSLPGPRGRRPLWLNLTWMATVVIVSLIGLAVYANLDRQTVFRAGGIVAAVFAICLAMALWIGRRRRHLIRGDASGETIDDRPVLNWFIWLWLGTVLLVFVNGGAILGGAGQALQIAFPRVFGVGGSKAWAIVIALLSAGILLSGRYKVLERFSVTLVATFTLITIVCTFLLQWTGFAIKPQDIGQGLTFDLPIPLTAGVIMTALAMYAGTGVGSGEMMCYSYWCVEKGYARNTGKRQTGTQWPRRARGWIRVMYIDVLVTMIVYTVSTICFYFLGAAILHKKGLDPDGPATLRVLQEIYVGTLGDWAATLFVVSAFFVLFSTVVSGVAGYSRQLADGLCVMRIIDAQDFPARLRFIRIFIVVSLVLYAVTYNLFENPPMMLIATSGIIAAALFPAIGLGTLYLRYRRIDPRIAPGKLITFCLWICGLALAVISPAAILFALAIGWMRLAL